MSNFLENIGIGFLYLSIISFFGVIFLGGLLFPVGLTLISLYIPEIPMETLYYLFLTPLAGLVACGSAWLCYFIFEVVF